MVEVVMSSLFKRQKKRLTKKQIKRLDNEIRKIVDDPTIGTLKRGDLKGVYVQKFKVDVDQFLLAYEFDKETRYLIMIGFHENFYRDLKRYRN